MPLALLGVVGVAGGVVTAGVAYYATPKYTRAGYQPVQPVPFSHAVHAGQLGMDCRYCHSTVEKIVVFKHSIRDNLHELPQSSAEGRSASGHRPRQCGDRQTYRMGASS